MRTRGKRDRQRGIALVMTSAALAVITLLVVEFSYNETVNYVATNNSRDEMRAHYLAQSAMNLSRLVIKVQKDIIDKYRRQIGDIQLADYLPMIMGAFGGGKDEVESIASLVGNVDTTSIKGLGLSEGEFNVEVTTDDGKINVNCAGGQPNTQKQVELMLTALVAPVEFNPLFEERDGDGQFTDRAMFIKAVIDWIDRDQAAYAGGGQAEQYGYESMKDPYKPRDNYIDSIDELQLVRGMDDRKWEIFGPAFTAYGGCKVNVSAVADLNVIAALIYQAAKNPDDPVLRDMQKLYALAARIAQARAFGYYFDDLAAFIEFVKDPDAALGEVLGDPNAAPGSGSTMQVEGVELDQQKLSQVARAGGRRTYRVVATAKFNRVEKTIVGIWDTDVTNQNSRDPAQGKGAWVYWREE